MTLDHLSHSSLDLFISCARSWYEKYINGKKSPPSEAASFGSDFDKAVAVRIIPGSVVPEKPWASGVDAAVTWYLAQPGAWTSATAAQIPIDVTPGQWHVLAEHYGSSAIDLALPITGFIDLERTDGIRLILNDLKTSSRLEFRPSWSVQTMLYALVRRAHEFEIHLLTRRASGSLGLKIYKHRPTEADYRWVMNYVSYYATAAIEAAKRSCSEDLPAKPGYYCSWCPIRAECVGAYLGNLNASGGE